MIVAGGYDVVLAATGAKVNIPNIPGLKDENGKLKPEYMSCLDTCGKEPKLGKHVVIVGGSEVGIETAMYLCGKGHDVTVLTRQKKLAHNASGLHYITWHLSRPAPTARQERRPHGRLTTTSPASPRQRLSRWRATPLPIAWPMASIPSPATAW